MDERLARRTGQALVWKGLQAASSRGLSLVRYLVLARILAPEAFGLLAVAMAAIDLLLRLTDINLVPALIQREHADRRHYDSAWTVGVIRGAAVTAVLFLGSGWVAAAFDEPRAAPLLAVLCLRPVLVSLASIGLVDLNRGLRFRRLAGVEVPAALVETVAAVLLAPGLGVWALVVAALAADSLLVVLSYVAAPYRPRLRLERAALAPLVAFGRWLFVAAVAGVVGETFLRLVVSRQLGTDDLGRYLIAQRFAAIPLELGVVVLGTVAFPLHSGLQRDDARARRTFQASAQALLVLLAPAYAVLIALAPALVGVGLGARWAGTSGILALMAATGLVLVLDIAAEPLLKGRGRGRELALVRTLGAVAPAALAWPLAGRYGLIGAGVALVIGELITQVVVARVTSRTLAGAFRSLPRTVAAVLAVALAAAAAARLVVALGGWPGLVLGLLAGAATALAGLWAVDRRLRLGLLDLLRRAVPLRRGRALGR